MQTSELSNSMACILRGETATTTPTGQFTKYLPDPVAIPLTFTPIAGITGASNGNRLSTGWRIIMINGELGRRGDGATASAAAPIYKRVRDSSSAILRVKRAA